MIRFKPITNQKSDSRAEVVEYFVGKNEIDVVVRDEETSPSGSEHLVTATIELRRSDHRLRHAQENLETKIFVLLRSIKNCDVNIGY